MPPRGGLKLRMHFGQKNGIYFRSVAGSAALSGLSFQTGGTKANQQTN